ncbi:hypothetical protein OG909_17420 [Streptomyces sp. NBC_01754]|uniref:hypothetical protein n=1 Tax=Streptomyces sp. NBC_01754 TaxID=2975930 RepID=UPI002DDC4754|nr:hypothetical protein [Streptomyces sp. NBC_01754]WSC93904.1 hypothetical protein OG909_17420 [Streptomyces sp. NBC_01754]
MVQVYEDFPAPPGAGPDRTPGQDTETPAPAHRPGTVERGSFCFARCPCGWSGPARRSRDRARTDADGHGTPAVSGPARTRA